LHGYRIEALFEQEFHQGRSHQATGTQGTSILLILPHGAPPLSNNSHRVYGSELICGIVN
jgi:hypothetical protein